MISELNVRTACLKSTFTSILCDERIKIILEYSLAAGNFLNG